VTGHFIAFEGGEGSGKSTQARRLAERLGSRALFTFEPGDSPLGAEVRRLLLDSLELEITDRAEALLMAADRAQHVVQVVQPALEAGRTVITDRFAGSSVAYQGHGRQLPATEIEQLSRWATDGLWPDLVLLLEVSPGDAEARLARAKDRVESAGAAFHTRVHDGFLVQAMADPDRWAIIDGTMPEDDVAAAIWEVVSIRFPDLV
jgi:dTMP kinase